MPGIVVPEELQDELNDAGAGAAEVGFAHARGLVEAAAGRVEGIYIVAPFRRPTAVLELLD